MKKVIGIVVAMQREAEPLTVMLGAPTSTTAILGIPVSEYAYKDVSIVIALSGVGSVESGSATSILTSRFGANLILNYGYVGSLRKIYNIFDIVKVGCVYDYQYDLRVFGNKLGQHDCLPNAAMPTDTALTNSLGKDLPVATLASGDAFITDTNAKERLSIDFGADICDMEGKGIALVCVRAHIPFAMLKVVSDGIDDGYEAFDKNSRDISGTVNIIYDFLMRQ